MRSSLVAVCMLLFCGFAFAQDAGECPAWMKSAFANSGSLRKNLDAKSGEAAAADAQKLSETFSHVHQYYVDKKMDKAAEFAANAQTGFEQVGKLASDGKFDEAAEAMKTAQSNCGGCHRTYREKAADGTWKIKTE